MEKTAEGPALRGVEAKKPGRAADSVDKVYEEIKTMAVEYRFKPGERVNEVELAAKLGVSRTPVREALNRLARDSFMSFVPNKGFYARDITPEGVRELYELRAAIERAAFRLACQRGSDEEIAAMAASWQNGSNIRALKTNWAKLAEADEVFHLGIVKLSGNQRMLSALEAINSLIRFFRRIDVENQRRRLRSFDDHAAILDRLKQRDADKGGELIERHITLSSEHAVEVSKEGLARIFFHSAG